MTDAVLDASVVLKWFHSEGEEHVAQARLLRERFEAGELHVLAPRLLWLEVVNVAARRWRLDSAQLVTMARSLMQLGFEAVHPDLTAIAGWAARGLTAYDAAYVVAAQDGEAPLITADAEILAVAPAVAVPLSAVT